MHFQEVGSNMAFSQIRSSVGNDLYGSRVGTQHSLPPITQPLLAKYRLNSEPNKLVIEESQSFWCKLFGGENEHSLSMCKCERTENGLCSMVMGWVGEYYDWQTDPKFGKAYHNYTRRNIEIFLTDSEIQTRLDKKLELLGVRLGEKYRAMLLRVCKNYLKHTIYYGKSEQLTRENDLWMWFAIGIFYHVGASLTHAPQNKEEEILFWALDIVMNHFGTITHVVLQTQIKKVLELFKSYFPAWFNLLLQHGIDLEPIVYEWMNELMMGYMRIDLIAFFLDCLLKMDSWIYVSKIFLSYFEKRVQQMEKEELFKVGVDREVLTRQLLTCNEEWPLIYCNAATFGFDRSPPTL